MLNLFARVPAGCAEVPLDHRTGATLQRETVDALLFHTGAQLHLSTWCCLPTQSTSPHSSKHVPPRNLFSGCLFGTNLHPDPNHLPDWFLLIQMMTHLSECPATSSCRKLIVRGVDFCSWSVRPSHMESPPVGPQVVVVVEESAEMAMSCLLGQTRWAGDVSIHNSLLLHTIHSLTNICRLSVGLCHDLNLMSVTFVLVTQSWHWWIVAKPLGIIPLSHKLESATPI